MKKIIIIFLVILLCGCQTTNNHKVKAVKKNQDYQQLSKYEIIDVINLLNILLSIIQINMNYLINNSDA